MSARATLDDLLNRQNEISLALADIVAYQHTMGIKLDGITDAMHHRLDRLEDQIDRLAEASSGIYDSGLGQHAGQRDSHAQATYND